MSPEIIDQRYVLTADVRVGGMAEVRRAMDIQTGRVCAIKRMLNQPNDRLVSESFFREYRALEDLKHPNIVEMLSCGRIEDGSSYIALEWVDHNLEEWIGKEGPMTWSAFWPAIGRPLLDAIKTAQASKWIHRDIKPKNVLVTSGGVPKLSDYGIARDHSAVMSPLTFRDFNSKPYSAPDPDDGSEYGYSRDVFSWVMVSGYCMSGREPIDYGEIDEWLSLCPGAPVEILRRAASLSREERPRFAALLLSELDEWVEAISKVATAPRCYIHLEPNVLTYVREILGQEGGDPESALRLDFAVVQGARLDSEDNVSLRLYGANWLLFAKRDDRAPGLLNVSRARFIGNAEAERQRDAGFAGPIDIRFGKPQSEERPGLSLDALFAEAAASEHERELRHKGDPDRVFRAWHAYLSARFEFETSRSSALRYSDLRVSGRTVSLTISDPLPLDLIGQDRLVRARHGKFVALEVLGANRDEITLAVMVGDPNLLPREGLLEVNTVRAEKALERQRQALNAVMHRRSVNPSLRDLIVDPSSASTPGSALVPTDAGPNFDADKILVLTRSLNVAQILTVEGPPGTGKTRLIEEIILQYLERYPKHRLLLSSQTHVALDNVIDRILQRGSYLNIIRVGRLDDQRISSGAAGLLLERKAQVWSKAARENAQAWLENWARVGVDPKAIEGGMLALSLASLIAEKANLEVKLNAIASSTEADTGDDAQELGPDDQFTRETVSATFEELLQRRTNIEEDEVEVRDKMKAIGGIVSELAGSKDLEDLREFSQVLLGAGPINERCRELMELQQLWLERVGRSSDFHGAMLSSANVVAATCVGLAGVRGIEGVAFDLCIVDEASKATATEILVPLSRSRRAILVGDPKQLPPFFEQGLLGGTSLSDFREDEIRENIFDRFLEHLPKDCRSELRHQYRMAKPIGDLISAVFYNNSLVSPRERPKISFPQFPCLTTWLDTSDFQDRRETRQGFGFVNHLEARVVRKTLESLAFVSANRRKEKYTVAVITGYLAQARVIENAIMDVRPGWANLDIKISTVDAFQGSEADICIYSVVRSNRDDKVGFLREPPRLNVALSRGRDLLLIVGDHMFCSGLGPELPLSEVVRYGAEHPEFFEVRRADVS